jgi:PAS domain S-box-containing protein
MTAKTMSAPQSPDARAADQPFVPSAALFQTALDGDPCAVAIMDRSFRFVAVNAAWMRITGQDQAVIGRTSMQVFGSSLRQTRQALGGALAGRELIKTYRASDDGRLRQVTVRPWRDDSGAIAGVITRQPADHDPGSGMERHKRRLDLAMQMAKLHAYEIDFQSGEVTYEPAYAEAVQGVRFHSFEEIIATLPEAERTRRLTGWEKHLATGQLMISDYPRPSPGGGVQWQRTVAEAVRGFAGEVVGLVGVTQDIDDQKRTELALVAEKEAAQSANRAKGEFLANMSHEIRTPLTSIIGFAELLRNLDGLPELAQTYVQRVATAGQSLLSVINDILDFSKLEAGQVELDPHPFDPMSCVGGVIDLLTPQAVQKGLTLDCHVPSPLPAFLDADSARIRQVLINLLGNAVKFTQRGGVTVTVDYQPQAGGRLRVAVRDTGEGVCEDARERLFQRFSQVDGSVSRRHGGSGLGLAICKSLVELMGGSLGFESEVGRGSTFWFSVPASESAVAAEPDIGPTAQALAPRGAHILIVDDVSTNRELVRTMLAPMGHSFEECDNGADAVKAAMQVHFDLILMDLQMPGMDGLAAARAIRATAEINKDTPILAFSANVLAKHTEAALAAGMNDHIAKPISPVELLTKVAMWTCAQEGDEGEEINELRVAS